MAASNLLLALVLLIPAYALGLVVFRLVLHPLRSVPGPKLAAATSLYELYHNCIKHGQYAFHVQKLHRKYGPIVRINPWEVHIDDPAYFDLFYSNNKLDKDAWFYRMFGDNNAAVGTAGWEIHKARRGAMAKFFSTANVAKLEPKVMGRVKLLLDRIEEHKRTEKVVDISNAYRCYATDVISAYAAPHSRDFLTSPDFAATFNRVLRDFSGILIWHRHIPIVFPVMNAIPKSIIAKMDSTGANLAVVENQEELLKQAKTVVDRKGVPENNETPTVLDAIYTSPLLGPEEKTVTRILAEAQAILGAGTETTGNTLAVLTYHVLAQPDVHQRLVSELDSAAAKSTTTFMDDALLDNRVLADLPYLQACIREALRLATGVCSRLPRSTKLSSTTYTDPSGREYVFPPGTVISMSILDLHYNPSIFPSPTSFDPDRWLNASKDELRQMERAYAPFGRGARSCVGLELAKEEINLLAGNLFWKFGESMTLFETSERDVSMAVDFFAPFAPADSKGVRVIVK